MSIQQSYLVQSNYGYDTVVAVSQRALNDIIKTYYYNTGQQNKFSEQTCYFTKDGAGNPVAISQASLLAQTGNTDPFNIPAWNGSGAMPAGVSTMVNSAFYFAFKFRPGDPSGIGLGAVNYIKLNPAKETALYYLLCNSIQVVFWNPDNKTWVNVTQTKSGEFNINASITLQNITDNTNLPPAVQAEVNNLGNTGLNVQQLIFDLDSAVVDPTSSLPGLDNTCSVFAPLMNQFAIAYFNAYTAVGGPVLNYAITRQNAATLMPTAMNLYTNALVDANGNAITNPTADQQNLATLNYLFSVNGDALPAGAQLNWNWLDDNGSDITNYNGAISIKRDAFAKYLQSQLNSYVLGLCWQPQITVGSNMWQDEYTVTYMQTTPPFSPFQSLNVNEVDWGYSDQLLAYVQSGNAQANGWVQGDYMKVITQCMFTVSIDPSGTLSIFQVFYLQIDAVNNGTPWSGYPFNKSYKDTFSVTVDDQGNINFTNISSTSTDTSQNTNLPGYISDALRTYNILGFANAAFTQVPVTMPRQFVFPGGNAFTFKDARFSEYSDLVCHVTYLSES